jgi:hypothetical protein
VNEAKVNKAKKMGRLQDGKYEAVNQRNMERKIEQRKEKRQTERVKDT